VPERNVEVVQRVFRAFRDRDEQALFANYAPDIEWDLRGYTPWTDQDLFAGHDGVREFFRQWLADFDDYSTEAREPVSVGDRVAITVHDRAVGRRSGAPIERVHCQVWTFRDGLVTRIQILDGRAEALGLLGLTE